VSTSKKRPATKATKKAKKTRKESNLCPTNPPKRNPQSSNSQASTRKKAQAKNTQAKNSILERLEKMTEQLLADLEDSPDNSQTALETPSDKASPLKINPSSRQLSTGNGDTTKKSKVPSTSLLLLLLHCIFNTFFIRHRLRNKGKQLGEQKWRD
jgi:hypothetical protein